MIDYQTIKQNFSKAKTNRDYHINQISKYQSDILNFETDFIAAKEAQLYIQHIAEQTQKNLEYRISNLVSTALSAVFEDPEQFRVKFSQRRGRTECDLIFIKNDREMDPIGFTGGGVLDITCFALKISFLLLKRSKFGNRLIFISDEPFRNLHGQKERENCSDMVKMISKECKIQIIMVSDVEEVNKAADRVFKIELKNKVSEVSVI